MTQFVPAFFVGWLLTMSLLVTFHQLWNDAIEEVRYGLGAGAICAGCSVAGLIIDSPILMFGPWVISSAGLVIVLIQWFERRTRRHGELTGIARGLSEELRDVAREPRHSGHGRQN